MISVRYLAEDAARRRNVEARMSGMRSWVLGFI
jgi:hypothetical protein